MPADRTITSGNAPTYKSAGVDIDAGNALVEAIKPLARSTARPGSDAGLGGFGGLFDLRAAGFEDPVLVAATDGVGTKLKIAISTGRHDTIGIDLVAMCVNDLVVQGAEPLFFLDYFATARLDVEACGAVVTGIAEGCRQAGCALIGGETAEMPGLYGEGDYDLAGFAVGAVERGRALTGRDVAAGDRVLALASNGLHANGFSLVRRVVSNLGVDYADPAPFAAELSLGDALLTPTRIYVRPLLDAIKAGGVKGLAHITGGGLPENLPRVLPERLAARLDLSSLPCPPAIEWIAQAGGVARAELRRAFNCGVGMAVIVAPDRAAPLAEILTAAGEEVHTIGRIEAREADAPAILFEPSSTEV